MIKRSGERAVKLTRYSQTDAINQAPLVYAYIKDITMHLHRIWQNTDSNHLRGCASSSTRVSSALLPERVG